MMLTGPDGNSFQLSLEGYQYPNRASRGEQDEAANRLLVSVEASIHDQAWQKTSPLPANVGDRPAYRMGRETPPH